MEPELDAIGGRGDVEAERLVAREELAAGQEARVGEDGGVGAAAHARAIVGHVGVAAAGEGAAELVGPAGVKDELCVRRGDGVLALADGSDLAASSSEDDERERERAAWLLSRSDLESLSS